MIPLIVVRPEPGASASIQAAQALGLAAQAHPIFAIRPEPWEPVPRDQADALILGSANALRHGGPALDTLRALPAYCVGETTAKAAEARGFTVACIGSGGLQSVVDRLAPGHRRLLRLTGVSHVPLALPPGITMQTRAVYASHALPMTPELARALGNQAVVMLHSGEAARHFEALCAAAAIDRTRIALATIGPRLDALAGSGWALVRSADVPSDAALLALASQMCQDTRWEAEKPR